MKRILLSLLIIYVFSSELAAQGVSFSYLIPKNGYLTAPISPFSLRGIGIGESLGVETGFSLYNVPGQGMEHLPFSYDKPLTGPHFAVLIPAEFFIKIPMGTLSLKLSGGGFLWRNFNQRINEGNMDRAFREYENWDVLNTNFSMDNKIGYGWIAGTEVEYAVNRDLSISIELHYLSGQSSTGLSGSYSGGTIDNTIETKTIDLPKAAMLLEGLEISFGVSF